MVTTSEIFSALFHSEIIAKTRKAKIHTTNSKEITHALIVEATTNSDLTPSKLLPPYMTLLTSQCFAQSSAVDKAHNV